LLQLLTVRDRQLLQSFQLLQPIHLLQLPAVSQLQLLQVITPFRSTWRKFCTLLICSTRREEQSCKPSRLCSCCKPHSTTTRRAGIACNSHSQHLNGVQALLTKSVCARQLTMDANSVHDSHCPIKQAPGSRQQQQQQQQRHQRHQRPTWICSSRNMGASSNHSQRKFRRDTTSRLRMSQPSTWSALALRSCSSSAAWSPPSIRSWRARNARMSPPCTRWDDR
jgi:hypothetical protein